MSPRVILSNDIMLQAIQLVPVVFNNTHVTIRQTGSWKVRKELDHECFIIGK